MSNKWGKTATKKPEETEKLKKKKKHGRNWKILKETGTNRNKIPNVPRNTKNYQEIQTKQKCVKLAGNRGIISEK